MSQPNDPSQPPYQGESAPQAPPSYSGQPSQPGGGYMPPAPPMADGQYPGQSASPMPAPDAPVPGRTLGIVAVVVAVFFSVVGIILGFVARSISRKAGVSNGPATAAIIVGFVLLVLQIIAIIGAVALFGGLISTCAELGPGVHTIDGITYRCG